VLGPASIAAIEQASCKHAMRSSPRLGLHAMHIGRPRVLRCVPHQQGLRSRFIRMQHHDNLIVSSLQTLRLAGRTSDLPVQALGSAVELIQAVPCRSWTMNHVNFILDEPLEHQAANASGYLPALTENSRL
jgi:hypothetical protein